MFRQYKKIMCADGFAMSVQASSTHYCSPRVDDASRYSEVEVGFPTEKEELLEKYAEDPSAEVNPKKGVVETVYGWVPSDVVLRVIDKHGGIESGELPPLK